MKVLYKLTIENLKKNMAMTMFYCICAFMSVVMLISMVIFFHSNNNFKLNYIQYIEGDHEFESLSPKDQQHLRNTIPEEHIADDVTVSLFGFVEQNDGSYIKIKSINQIPKRNLAFYQMGNYPAKENEIMVSKRYLDAHQLQLNDTISLNVVDPLHQERIHNQIFTITGTYGMGKNSNKNFVQYKDPSGKNHPITEEMMTFYKNPKEQLFDSGFITLQDMDGDKFLQLKSDIAKRRNDIMIKEELVDKKYFTPYDSFSWLYIGIILFFSIFLTHLMTNMSILSYKKRLRDVGMLQSIGATSKQLFTCSLIETGLYALLVIPIAILFSVILMIGVLQYVSTFLNVESIPFPFVLILNIKDIALIVLIDVIIILLCNLIPVIKMRHYTVIDLIKGNMKQKNSKYRKYKRLERVFGVEAKLAKRNQNRNKRVVRSVTISITMSVAICISGNYIFSNVGGFEDPNYIMMLGIAILLTMIALMNVCCVTYSNIILRKKEHIMLVSIGLENHQLMRMLYFENGSVMIKGLIFGIPLGLLINGCIFQEMLKQSPDAVFVIPWIEIIILTLSIVLISSILVYVAYRSIKKESLISSIKE